MIFDWLIGLLLAVFNGVLGLFPAYSLPSSVTSFGTSIGSAVGTANGLFPVVTLGICIGVMIVARVFIAAWAAVAWAYAKIPFKMT